MTTSTSGTTTGSRRVPPAGGGRGPARDSAIDGGVPPLGPAIAFVRRLRHGIENGPMAMPGAALEALGSLPAEVREAIDRSLQRAAGEYDEDEWGFDEEFALGLRPALDFLYDRWWRVETT